MYMIYIQHMYFIGGIFARAQVEGCPKLRVSLGGGAPERIHGNGVYLPTKLP